MSVRTDPSRSAHIGVVLARVDLCLWLMLFLLSFSNVGRTFLNLRKTSIFASPDTIDGKVGVTGSGAGMTDFRERKKYKLNQG